MYGKSQCHGIEEDEERKEVVEEGGEGEGVDEHGGEICREKDS